MKRKAIAKTTTTKAPKPTHEELEWGPFLVELTGFFGHCEIDLRNGFPEELKRALLAERNSPLQRFSLAGVQASEGLVRFIENEIEAKHLWQDYRADRTSILRDVKALKKQLEYGTAFINNFSQHWDATPDQRAELANGLLELGNHIGRLHERILIRFAEWLARLGHERQESVKAMHQGNKEAVAESKKERFTIDPSETWQVFCEVRKQLGDDYTYKVACKRTVDQLNSRHQKAFDDFVKHRQEIGKPVKRRKSPIALGTVKRHISPYLQAEKDHQSSLTSSK